MAEHTPGPWTAEIEEHRAPSDRYSANVYAGQPTNGYRSVARIPQPERAWDGDEQARAQADARLIAAAPSLLWALESLLEEFGARLSDGKPLGYTVASMNHALTLVKTADAAITKARGE